MEILIREELQKKKLSGEEQDDGHGDLKKDWRKVRRVYGLEDGRK